MEKQNEIGRGNIHMWEPEVVVIDYGIVSEEIIEKIRNFKIGEKVNSDHLAAEN